MTAGTVQPEAGFYEYHPQLFSSDLNQLALEAEWKAALGLAGSSESPEVVFKTGAPGGPYTVVASVPRTRAGAGWVGASANFSKLMLEVEDRKLIEGHPTSTKSGEDLYEYAGGVLRQANVDSAGVTIGACGATAARGYESTNGSSSAHAVSIDGSRVFFEAVPGTNCSEATHLYMREAAAGRTVDIGPYSFAGADGEGTKLLLERHVGENDEFLLYDAQSETTTPAFSRPSVDRSRDIGLCRFQCDLSGLRGSSDRRCATSRARRICGSLSF